MEVAETELPELHLSVRAAEVLPLRVEDPQDLPGLAVETLERLARLDKVETVVLTLVTTILPAAAAAADTTAAAAAVVIASIWHLTVAVVVVAALHSFRREVVAQLDPTTERVT
jgi:hypothetical protein